MSPRVLSLCCVLATAAVTVPVAAQSAAPNNTTVVQPAQPAQPAAAPAQPVVQQTQVNQEDDDAPSIFATASQGLLAGTLVGISGGYLVGRRDDWERADWRAVGLGAGIGALSGAGFGLMLGFMDRGGAHAGRYIPRDMVAGAGFGALIGVIGGGISAARNDEGERVLLGTTIGVISGAGLGILTGIIEGSLKNNHDKQTTTVTSKVKLRPNVSWSRDHGTAAGALTTGLYGNF
jgi:hypothetical protein